MTPAWDLRCGRWQDALADVGEVDAVITDPPYGARTAAGFRGLRSPGEFSEGIPYGFIQDGDVADLVARWTPRVMWWFVAFTDTSLAPTFVSELEAADWYTFAAVPWVKPDAPPRFTGDGPSCASEWIVVARKKRRLPKARVGSRPGFYRHNVASEAKNDGQIVRGGKPILLMRAIVRDYTERGDMVVDPFAGGATTLLAAVTEGRRAVGAECDPTTYAKARRRLEGGYTPDLFGAAL